MHVPVCVRVCVRLCMYMCDVCTVCDRVEPESAAAFTCNALKIQHRKCSWTVCLQYSVLLPFVLRFNIIYLNILPSVFGKGTLSALLLTRAEMWLH